MAFLSTILKEKEATVMAVQKNREQRRAEAKTAPRQNPLKSLSEVELKAKFYDNMQLIENLRALNNAIQRELAAKREASNESPIPS
jgi:hypothetical protein